MKLFKRKNKVIKETEIYNIGEIDVRVFFHSGKSIDIIVRGHVEQYESNLDVKFYSAEEVLIGRLNSGNVIWKKEGPFGLEEAAIGEATKIKILARRDYFISLPVKSVK